MLAREGDARSKYPHQDPTRGGVRIAGYMANKQNPVQLERLVLLAPHSGPSCLYPSQSGGSRITIR
jgi:hypothetical protein